MAKIESLLRFVWQLHQVGKSAFAAKSPHDRRRGHSLKAAQIYKEIN